MKQVLVPFALATLAYTLLDAYEERTRKSNADKSRGTGAKVVLFFFLWLLCMIGYWWMTGGGGSTVEDWNGDGGGQAAGRTIEEQLVKRIHEVVHVGGAPF